MRLSANHLSKIRETISLTLIVAFFMSNVIFANAIVRHNDPVAAPTAADVNHTIDLTQLGREGRLREDLSFEGDTNRLMKALAGNGSRQPVIVDEKGEYQERIVEQLALRIAKGVSSSELAGFSIKKLEIDTIYATAKSQSEIADRIAEALEAAAASSERSILFVDELPYVLSLEKASAALIGSIAKQDIRIIGGSSRSDYAQKIEADKELNSIFEAIEILGGQSAANDAEPTGGNDAESYRGDNISSDIRAMIDAGSDGNQRIGAVLQAKNADNPAFRAMLAASDVRITDRIGTSNTLVIDLPLRSVASLSQSGMINYLSPDRKTQTTGHIEDTIGATLVRSN